jgi:neutral ceramidase
VEGGEFEAVTDQHGRPQSSFDGVVVVTYTPEPLDAAAPEHHVYAATWQPVAAAPLSLTDPAVPFSLDKGRYRLSAAGRARATGGIEEYRVSSTPVDVVDATLAGASSAARTAGGLDLHAVLGSAPGMRALRASGPSDDSVPLAGPWQVTVTKGDTTTVAVSVVPNGASATVSLSPFDAAAAVSVDIRDPSGNRGALVVR